MRQVAWAKRGGWGEMQDEKVYFYATRGPDGEFASLAAMVVGDGSSTWRWIPNFGE